MPANLIPIFPLPTVIPPPATASTTTVPGPVLETEIPDPAVIELTAKVPTLSESISVPDLPSKRFSSVASAVIWLPDRYKYVVFREPAISKSNRGVTVPIPKLFKVSSQ